MEFIESEAVRFPEFAEVFSSWGTLFTRKLWHQLTTEVESFVSVEGNSKGDNFVRMHGEFLSKFEAKINQLKFAQITCLAAKQISDPKAAIEFLEGVAEKRERLGDAPYLVLQMDISTLKMKQGETEEANTLLEKGQEILSSMADSDTAVHSAYHNACCMYYKMVGPPDAFYASALQYLAYTPLERMSAEERVALATDVSLAALSGDKVFNFGEVLQTPILESLAGTPGAWLGEMMTALGNGNVDRFSALLADNGAAFSSHPALATRVEFVKQKACLLAVVEALHGKPAAERAVTFKDLAAVTKLPVDQVEWLVMRAMSLGLLKGKLDQVDQLLRVTWVQPRVLDKENIQVLSDRLVGWGDKVHTTLVSMEDQTAQLLR